MLVQKGEHAQTRDHTTTISAPHHIDHVNADNKNMTVAVSILLQLLLDIISPSSRSYWL